MAINLARYMVTIHGDFSVFRREVHAEAARLAGTSFKVKPDLDVTVFRKQWQVFSAAFLRDITVTIRPVMAPGGLTSSAFRNREMSVKPKLDLTIFRAQWRVFAATFLNVIHRIHVHPIISPTAVSGVIDAFSDAGERSAGSFGRGFSARWKLIIAGIVAALPLLAPVLQVLGDVVQAAGAVGAALPAMLAATALGVGTLITAFHNLGDAIKGQFSGDPTKGEQEAFDKLSKSAKQFVGILLEMRTGLKGFQTEIQERFFAPFNVGFRTLAQSNVFGILRANMALLAEDFGRAGARIAEVFAASGRSGQLQTILAGSRESLAHIVGILPRITAGFLTLAAAAQPFVEAITVRLVNGIAAMLSKLEEASAGGGLAKFFEDGKNQLFALIDVIGNVGEILKTVFDAFNGGSDTALSGLAALTQQFSEFLKSAQGQEILSLVADKLSLIGDVIESAILPLLPVLTDLAKAISGPLGEGIRQILPALENLINAMSTGLRPVIEALAPVFDKLVTVVADFVVVAIRELNAHITQAMPFLKELADKIGPMLTPLIEAMGEALLALIPLIPALSGFILALLPLLIQMIPVFSLIIAGLTLFYKMMAVVIGWIIKIIFNVNLFIAVFEALKIAIGAVRDFFVAVWGYISDWFMNKILPSLKKAVEDIGGFFTKLGRSIGQAVTDIRNVWDAGWAFVRDNVFNPLKTFITETIPNAFRTGVDAIGRAWDRIKELARVPVKFVVDVIVNPLINAFNSVSKFFGGPQLPNVPTIGDGPGLPVPQGRGFGDGPGKPGTGDGLGLGDILGLVKGPAEWLAGKVGIGQIAERFGNGGFTQVLTGLGKKLLESAVDKIKSLISAGIGLLGGGGDSGVGLQAGIASVLANLRAVFGNVPLISGRRPGDRTLSGSISYHSSGRAIDIAPVLAWAQFLSGVYGSQLRELITPWNSLNIHNGRPHTYTGAVWNQHNFAGGNAHIHAALFRGGTVNEPVFGVGRSGRTYSFGEREPEHVVPGGQMAELISLIRALIGAVERVAPGIGRELTGASMTALHIGRARA